MKIGEDLRPMMAEKEIEIIDDILNELRPTHCLEWGSGNSTIYFPSRHYIKTWTSVEHNGHYVQYLTDKLPDNTNIIWVPENEWYVDCIKHSRVFDFIFIDGLHRERCLEIAKKIISDDGVILLHDASRREYHEFIKKHGGEMLIQGEIPQGDFFAHRGIARFTK